MLQLTNIEAYLILIIVNPLVSGTKTKGPESDRRPTGARF